MKKLFALVMVLMVALLAVSCKFGTQSKGTVTIYIGDETTQYTVRVKDLENANNVKDVLDYLKENENLTFECVDSGYGAVVTKIGNLAPDADAHEYIAIYTTNEKDFSVPPYDTSVTVGEKTFVYSGNGISQMSIDDGTAVLFVIESW
ncbi:MAG: hypothetical protein IJ811_02170 [Clostridia bacterium]|nr:hypothetical protein [Clostridia bacterium]